MSPYRRNLLAGTVILLIAAYWAFLAFRQYTIMATDFRGNMTYVEHLVVESANDSGATDKKDIWMRALIFDENSIRLRGSKANESHMQMTRRWIAALKLPYWPSLILAAVGIALCVSPSTKIK